MNAATITSSRYNALLLEGDKGLGLEAALRDHQCSVRRATTRAAAQEAIEHVDLVVLSASGFSDEDILDLVSRATPHATVVVVTDKTDLAVKAAKQGATTAFGGSVEIASAQIVQALAMIDLKRRVAHKTGLGLTAPTSGVVQRRSTPLPKEATPDALEALIEAAEGLVPMHRFQRVYVDYALRRFGGNKVHTAAALGIDRRTIQRWARARAESSPTQTTNQSTTSS